MSFREDLVELRARIVMAGSERDAWRAAGNQEKYLEACSLVAALELRLERMHAQGLRRLAQRDAIPAAPLEPSIAFDGRHYHYDGYRYDHLDDALAYAKLQRSRPGERPAPAAPPRALEPPDARDLQTMASLAITFREGMYHLGPYRYDRLADAVSYARLHLTRPT